MRNGRVKLSVWAWPTGVRSSSNLRRALHHPGFWGLVAVGVACVFGSLVPLVLYPLRAVWALLVALPLILCLPYLIGNLLSFTITKFALK